ncbi:hypothetical protein ACHAXT_003389 [Thalassiosira profunda]
MEPTIVRYPIPGNEAGGLLHIYGDPKAAKNVVFYCGGWPDGVEPFTPLARRLAAPSAEGSDGCFVGITCWPGFDEASYLQSKFRGFRRRGFTFDEVTRCIREAAKQLFAEYYKASDGEERAKPQFTVIFHDFGVVTGLMFVNRSLEEECFTEHVPDRIVLLDILLGPHPKCRDKPRDIASYTPREKLVYLAYRGTNAASFTLMRYVSESVGLFVFGMLWSVVSLLGLGPLRPIDGMLLKQRRMNPFHMLYTFYPYHYLFRAMLGNTSRIDLAHAHLPLDLVRTPVLFLYGTEKNVMFHDHRSFAILEREERENKSNCRIVKVEGAGHWMYCQRPEVCEREIRDFLRSGINTDDESRSGNPQSKL